MKRFLLIFFCFPLFCFSQDKNTKKSIFNFKKSNNYTNNSKNKIKDNSIISIFDSTRIGKKTNTSQYIKKKDNVLPYPFNKGLIYMLSETLKNEKEIQKFTIKKKEKK